MQIRDRQSLNVRQTPSQQTRRRSGSSSWRGWRFGGKKKHCGGIGTVCVTLLLSNAIRLLTKRQEQNDTAILRTTPRRMQTPPSISSQNSWNAKIIVKENKKRKRNQRLPFSHVRFRSINLFVSYKQLHCVFFSYLFLFVSFLFPPFERLR